MADAARFCVGFSSACHSVRHGGDLPASGSRPGLPGPLVRLRIDTLVRRLEHEDKLLLKNHGDLSRTLFQAAGAGGLRDTRFLILRGADIDYLHAPSGEDVLARAAHSGRLAVVRVLLDAGASTLDSAIIMSALANETSVLALLLSRGALNYDTAVIAIRECAQHGCTGAARLLLDNGAVASNGLLRRAQHFSHDGVVALLQARLDAMQQPLQNGGPAVHTPADAAVVAAAAAVPPPVQPSAAAHSLALIVRTP